MGGGGGERGGCNRKQTYVEGTFVDFLGIRQPRSPQQLPKRVFPTAREKRSLADLVLTRGMLFTMRTCVPYTAFTNLDSTTGAQIGSDGSRIFLEEGEYFFSFQ